MKHGKAKKKGKIITKIIDYYYDSKQQSIEKKKNKIKEFHQ